MKKIFSFVFSLLILLSLIRITPNTAFAQVNDNNLNPYSVPNTSSDVKPSLHVWMQSALLDAMSAVSCQLSGLDPQTVDHRCLGINSKNGQLSYLPSNNGGLIAMLSGSMGNFFNLPIHPSDYTKTLADNFGLVKKADAAAPCSGGIGYCGLMPFESLWAAFRNVSYLFLTVIFLIVGLAIMFRVKIDPRTVMSIENQLPKLIIGLILITFSYAIAGLMIDLMYVLIYIIFNFFNSAAPNIPLVNALSCGALGNVKHICLNGLQGQDFQGSNPVEIINSLSPGTGGGFFGLIGQIAAPIGDAFRNIFGINLNWQNFIPGASAFGNVKDMFGALLGFNTNVSVFDTLINTASTAAGIWAGFAAANFSSSTVGQVPVIGGVVNFFTSTGGAMIFGAGIYDLVEGLLRWALPLGIAYLIFLVSVLFMLFKVWFSLLLAYAYIILDTILAPFWILGGLIPGSEVKFESWLRDLGANLLTFPVTIVMFLFASIMLQVGNNSNGQLFTPPLIGSVNGGGIPIGTLLGVAILFLTPAASQMVKDALKVKENKYGQQIGAGIGVGAGLLVNTGKSVGGGILDTGAIKYKKDAQGNAVPELLSLGERIFGGIKKQSGLG